MLAKQMLPGEKQLKSIVNSCKEQGFFNVCFCLYLFTVKLSFILSYIQDFIQVLTITKVGEKQKHHCT